MPLPIIRFMSRVQQTLYVTGYDGFAASEISQPSGTPIHSGEYVDVARIDGMRHSPTSRALFYIGLTSTGRDFTCCMQAGGGRFDRTIGVYRGAGAAPVPVLNPRYGHAFPEFEDGDGRRIWQFEIDMLPPDQPRIFPVMEGVAFTGEIFFRKHDLPKMVVAAIVRSAGGTFETTVQGWIKKDSGDIVPDEHTLVPIASITKTFTGHLLARVVAATAARAGGQAKVHPAVRLTDGVEGNPAIRLIDLATHTSGLPREVKPDIELDPSKPAQLPPVLFPPGTGALYSNVGFNVLGREIYRIHKESGTYGDLLHREVLSPLGLHATSFKGPPGWTPGTSDRGHNLFGGHDARGCPWTEELHDPTPRGASGLYSSPGDLLRWLEWHLQTGGDLDPADTEARLLNHAAWVQRDGLHPVFGLDECGRMDAMGLGWVVMMPQGDRPFILQKAGATGGVFSFIAFSPARGIGFFMAIDKFDIAAATEMPEMIIDLITSFAPR